MPGPPAAFTEKTVLFVTGDGGTGKSTFVSFLQEHPSILSIELDFFFKHDVIIERQPDPTCAFRTWVLSLNAPTRSIDKHTQTLLKTPSLLNAFVTILLREIEASFSDPSVRLTCLCGFSLQFQPLLGDLSSKLKSRGYRLWKCHP